MSFDGLWRSAAVPKPPLVFVNQSTSGAAFKVGQLASLTSSDQSPAAGAQCPGHRSRRHQRQRSRSAPAPTRPLTAEAAPACSTPPPPPAPPLHTPLQRRTFTCKIRQRGVIKEAHMCWRFYRHGAQPPAGGLLAHTLAKTHQAMHVICTRCSTWRRTWLGSSSTCITLNCSVTESGGSAWACAHRVEGVQALGDLYGLCPAHR